MMNSEAKGLIMLDRDGTLIKHVPYLNQVEQVEFMDGVFEALTAVIQKNYKLAIVTNQSAIGRGLATLQQVNKVNKFILEEFLARDISIGSIKMCPHTPEENCQCRKPKPYLGKLLINELKPDLNRIFMVGDKLIDMEFAINLGIKPINISNKVTSNIPSVEFAADWRDFQMNIVGKLIS